MLGKAIIIILTTLAMGTAGLGVGSYFHTFQWSFRFPQDWRNRCEIRSGHVGFASYNDRTLFVTVPRPTSSLPTDFAFYLERLSCVFLVPFWVPFLAFATYPVIKGYPVMMVFLRMGLHRRRWLREHGLCVNCTYDLTGNESGVCPECGTPVGQEAR